MLDLSIIIPAYNCADLLTEHIPHLLSYVARLNNSYEIIIADDGSIDNGRTRSVSEQLGCRWIGNTTNLGKGAAVRLGMLAASGRCRIFTDADVPFELEAIGRMVARLESGVDVVVGDRTLTTSHYFSAIPLLRSMASRIFSLLVKTLILGSTYDTQCGIKGFRAAVAEEMFTGSRVNSFAFDVELLTIALKRNYSIERIPVRLRGEPVTSSVRLARDSVRMFRDLAVIFWHKHNGFYDPH